jgi:hypothetical protein
MGTIHLYWILSGPSFALRFVHISWAAQKKYAVLKAPCTHKKELIFFRMESPQAYRRVSVHSVGQESSHVQRTGSFHSQRSFRQAPMGEGDLQDNFYIYSRNKKRTSVFPKIVMIINVVKAQGALSAAKAGRNHLNK